MSRLETCINEVEKFKTSYTSQGVGDPEILTAIKDQYGFMNADEKIQFKKYIKSKIFDPSVCKGIDIGAKVGAIVLPVVDAYVAGVMNIGRAVLMSAVGLFAGSATGAAMTVINDSDNYIERRIAIQPYRDIEHALKLGLFTSLQYNLSKNSREKSWEPQTGNLRQRRQPA